MSLPQLDIFEPFVNNFTFCKPNNISEYECAIICEKQYGMDGNERVVFEEQVFWYKKTSQYNLKTLLLTIQKELETKGHIKDEMIARILLGLSICCRRLSVYKALNNIIDSITPCDLNQLCILCLPKTEHPFNFGSFYVGPVNTEKLEYRCQKAKSDYFQRYGNRYQYLTGIERAPVKVKIVDWPGFIELVPSEYHHKLSEMCDHYFTYHSTVLFEDFWKCLKDEQLLTVALGSAYLNEKVVKSLPLCDYVTIYLNIGISRGGYVAPKTAAGFCMNWSDSHKSIPQNESLLKNEFNISSLGTSEIHQSIKSYASFIFKGREHYFENRTHEAFLHYVIAIDLLLGDVNCTTKSICNRASVLTSNKSTNIYLKQKELIKSIYNYRSKYVHKGETPPCDLLDKLWPICHDILLCLLRLQKENKNHEKGFIDIWFKNIDYISAALDANKNVDKEFALVGI